MKRIRFIGPIAILALLFFGLGVGLVLKSETPPELTIPVCKTMPRLDGILDDATWQEAAVINKLKPLYLETALGKPDTPAASIVTGDAYKELAGDLQQQIKEATGIKLPVISDSTALNDLKKHGNLIVLGQYGDNKVIEHFYYRWYLVVDGMQPGKGGYVLETVHNPDNLGINLVVLGGSDSTGVATAGTRFMEALKKHGATLPRIFEVELGEGKEIVLERGAEALDPKRVWPTNVMNIQEYLGEAAMLYMYTGDERYVVFFKTKLIEWLKAGVADSNDDWWRIIIAWDLVEEAPVFTDQERLWITNKIWDGISFLRPQWEVYVFSKKDLIEPRNNHSARSALSMYFLARYFKQYYGIEEMKQWLADVAIYWRPQMSSFMAMEGTDQAVATLMPATIYALAENKKSFLSRDVLGRIADMRVMKSRGGYLYGGDYAVIWLSLAAHLFDEPEYLRPVIRKYGSMAKADRFPSFRIRELGRSFWDSRVPDAAQTNKQSAADWVKAMPLARLYFDKVQLHGPRNISYEKSFDFIVFKDPEGRDRQYLELGGNNAGSYSVDMGNAITFLSRGNEWLSNVTTPVASLRKVSAVSIVRNGEASPVPAFTRLDRIAATPEWGITRTGYECYSGTDWVRNIINVPDKWFLVVDKITAQEPGDYVLESRWRIPVSCGSDGENVIAYQGNYYFHLTGAGWQSQSMIPQLYRDLLISPLHVFPRTVDQLSGSSDYQTLVVRRWTGRMEKGASHVFVNLFYGNAPRKPLYGLQELDKNRYLISNNAGQAGKPGWVVSANEKGLWVVEGVTDQKFPLPTRAVKPVPAALDLKPAWERKESARILSSAVMAISNGVRYAAGLADGRIRLIDEKGRDVAEAKMTGRIYALCAMDFDDDGSDELLGGSDTGGVQAFNADGSPRWSWTPPPWKRDATTRVGHGITRMVITGIQPADINGDRKPEILAMGADWYILDRKGQMRFIYGVEWSGPSWDGIVREQTYLVIAGDVMGDRAQEIVGDLYGVGDAGDCRCVNVWDGKTHEYLWRHSRPSNRFCGSALKAIIAADMDGDGKDEFAIASDAYDLQLGYYDYGPENKGIWYGNVGSGATALLGTDLTGDGKTEIVVGTEMGQVQAFDAKKNRLFVTDVDEYVTALAARPFGSRHEVWIGTVNGKILVLDPKGRIIRRGFIHGLADHMTVSKTGSVLVTTSDGHVALFANQ